MAVSANDTLPRVARPPRAMAWVVLMAAATAVLAVGVAATALLVGNLTSYPAPDRQFWLPFLGACLLTVGSIGLRSLRWIFLLRRADTRIPIRDAYIGYFAGLGLLFAPLLAGEIAVRAWVNRARGQVPVHTTIVVNVWERLLDLSALALLALTASLVNGGVSRWIVGVAVFALLSLVTPVRRLALDSVARLTAPVARLFDTSPAAPFQRLGDLRTWTAALGTSLAAWMLPALGLWLIARSPGHALSLTDAVQTYGVSGLASVATLTPGGVLVAGREMLAVLFANGFAAEDAVLAVFGVRLATTGVSVVLGWVFMLMHLRSGRFASDTHFDDIADAYDVQIPESRRHALLLRKTALMKDVIEAHGIGRRGLDVGCGQGAYVARMRTLGFEVEGIDMSAGQVRLAARNVGGDGIVRVGSVLDIPAADE
ncbi:MAG: lysylphosphatidylglycerol synthase domain-containing protein, partial [Vicinamibacterales bacterium]